MRTKYRLVAAIIVVALAALGVFYYTVTAVIEHAFDTIETQETYENADRAANALNANVATLQNKVSDWSDWDDTYAFVENRNKAYIASNLPDGSALTDLGINMMLFINQQQHVVYTFAVDPTSGNITTVPADVLANFAPGSKLLAQNPSSQTGGILVTSEGTFQFAAQPILTSESQGPIHGTLVFGQWLTPDQITNLGNLVKLKLSYVNLSGPTAAGLSQVLGQHPKAGQDALKRVSAHEIIGYTVMADAYGHPAIVAESDAPREVHDVATSAVGQFYLLVLVDTALAVIVCLFLINTIRARDRTIALKNEFFSIASHELRTPLTVIRDYAQLMKFQFAKRLDDPKFDHMADNIDQTGAQLIGLVNVFLDAARMEQGKIPFEVKPFVLQPLIAGIKPEISAAAAKKGITFTVECPPDLPGALGDEARVRQVILNLIGNAMKFTDTGGITLRAEADAKFVHVYVNDTGRGMDEAAQRVLFQRFSQVKSGDARVGSGLGLFISKKLIEQMGGRIGVESSAPGIGTSIGFSLPIHKLLASPAPTPSSTPPTPPPGSGSF